ncbi:MAG: aminotransferase class V-fold PLP-dependent enzyme [Saprospiraceae bacterium]|nr:aminotransferase class V-fold PLP-dependent enzyme [Saprospiraceae bacterium]
MIKRRTWLKNSVLGLAGAAVLSPVDLKALEDETDSLFSILGSATADEKYWKKVKRNFALAKGLRYFNNGSLGTCPDYVVNATNRFRSTLDSFPSKYMWGGWDSNKEQIRKKAAEMLGVSEETIALIHNTTEGMNLIASSMELQEGDEVLLSNHEHTSARIPWKYWQETKGVILKTVDLPLIPNDKEEVVDRFRKAITSRTRMISIVHLTNTNGMILPVKEISEMAHEKDIMVAVDGAQSMGMFKIDLDDLGCDYYTSSSHKWLFSPKGVGIFYARKEAQSKLKPLIVCRGYEDESIRRLENYNTRNLPELLGLGAALDYRAQIGEDRIQNRVYELKKYFRNSLADDQRFVFKTPESDDLSAGIQTVEVVGHSSGSVRRRLSSDYQIDCRPMSSHDINGLRISLAIFITKADVDYLVDALKTIAGK